VRAGELKAAGMDWTEVLTWSVVVILGRVLIWLVSWWFPPRQAKAQESAYREVVSC
jgi:hypothetical protein